MERVIIKCFETPMRKYFYDRSMNSVVAVTDDEYEVLKLVEKNGKLPKDDALKRFMKNGLLSKTVVTEIEHPETSKLKVLSENYIENLILQVTQQCNLRCKYCVYSGNYYNREHSTKRMSFDMAKRAIDFYLERSKKADELVVSFYGGEPLLEFELIKKCVNYILKKKGEKKVRFPMTTNGTLLNDEVIEFVVKNRFTLMISLDGNKDSHDINRRFRTGEGSFDIITKNLRKLKLYDETYYKENVLFNCVISSVSDLESVYQFYSETDLFEPHMVKFNLVNQVGIKDKAISEISIKNQKIQYLSYIRMLLSVLKRREWDNISRILRPYMVDVELMYEQLHRHVFESSKTHHGGPCIPGIRRLFVETDGQFFPCERVSEEDAEMNIGSIESGFNYEKMKFFLNHGKMIKNECISCWNLRGCSFCLNSIPKENQNLTKDKLLTNCEKSRQQTLALLYKLCIMAELGYRGNEDLKVYK